MDNDLLQDSLFENKWNSDYLETFIDLYSERLLIVKYQLSLLTLKLCINRDNLCIPKELWNIICEYIENEVRYTKQSVKFGYHCDLENKSKHMRGHKIPKYCPDDNCPLNNIWIESEYGHVWVGLSDY